MNINFWSRLFAKGESPTSSHTDEMLGVMEYSQDDEAWVGACNGRKYSLSYEQKRMPSQDIIAYAREVIGGTEWVDASVAEAKNKARLEHPAISRDEIETLTLGVIHFYKYQSNLRIIADMEGGKDGRCWRIEYHGKECEGIGFDD